MSVGREQARVIDLAALFGSEACCVGRRRCPKVRGGAGRLWGPPREGSRERGKTGRDRTPATADPIRPAPRRPAPGLALRRSKDIAAPSRLKRSRAAQLKEPDGRGPTLSRTACPAPRTPGGRELLICAVREHGSAPHQP